MGGFVDVKAKSAKSVCFHLDFVQIYSDLLWTRLGILCFMQSTHSWILWQRIVNSSLKKKLYIPRNIYGSLCLFGYLIFFCAFSPSSVISTCQKTCSKFTNGGIHLRWWQMGQVGFHDADGQTSRLGRHQCQVEGACRWMDIFLCKQKVIPKSQSNLLISNYLGVFFQSAWPIWLLLSKACDQKCGVNP